MKKTLFSLIIFSIFYMTPNNFKLLIKIPTRSRPQRFFKYLDEYYKKLSGSIPYHFLITCDQNDPTMNTLQIKKRLDKYPHLSYFFGNSTSKIHAYNKDINKIKDWDIILVTSDDLLPMIQNYDKIIVDTMKNHFPNLDGVLNFKDVYADDLNTYPILGRNYYEKFGYVYHPHYKSLCCDNELTYISKRLKKEYIDHRILLNHIHPEITHQLDTLYRHNESFGTQDKKTYDARKNALFNIDYETGKIIRWSILIPTINGREILFKKLYNDIENQIKKEKLESEIEIITSYDEGQKTIGKKRNELLMKSRGEYISFIDDDDSVHPTYIKTIYNVIKKHPDCISLEGIITFNGKNPRKFLHSIQHKRYFENRRIFYRPPNHLNPMRRDVAIRFHFPEKNFGEDTDWAMAISKSNLLKSETHIGFPYYFYNYQHKSPSVKTKKT